MEALNLQQLSLILDQDLVLLPEDVRKYTLAEKLNERPFALDDSFDSEIDYGQESGSEDEYAEEKNIIYEGNFEKGILVVFEGNSLESHHREFLFKILGAVGCSAKDVALVSSQHLLELPPQSIQQLNPQKCLVFGAFNHPVMQYKTSNYEIVSGATVYFFADPLDDLAENVQLKRNLWNGLQVLFQIKK